jgi:hypothetical protein
MRQLAQVGDVVLEGDGKQRLWRLRSPAYALTMVFVGRGQVAVLDWQNPRHANAMAQISRSPLRFCDDAQRRPRHFPATP